MNIQSWAIIICLMLGLPVNAATKHSFTDTEDKQNAKRSKHTVEKHLILSIDEHLLATVITQQQRKAKYCFLNAGNQHWATPMKKFCEQSPESITAKIIVVTSQDNTFINLTSDLQSKSIPLNSIDLIVTEGVLKKATNPLTLFQTLYNHLCVGGYMLFDGFPFLKDEAADLDHNLVVENTLRLLISLNVDFLIQPYKHDNTFYHIAIRKRSDELFIYPIWNVRDVEISAATKALRKFGAHQLAGNDQVFYDFLKEENLLNERWLNPGKEFSFRLIEDL